MNVGFLSTRLAGTDGVSLETAKIAELFRRMGHEVVYCAGELDADGPRGLVVDEMHFHHPEIRAIHDAAFCREESTHLRQRIGASVERLRREVCHFIEAFSLDLLIPQNVLAIPMNLPLGMAVGDEITASGIPAIAHHHDFSWERERFRGSLVQDLLDRYYPPDGATIHHAVISTLAQQQLVARRGIESVVLPNVLDFATGPSPRESRIDVVRDCLGFGEDDIVLLQPTRVVPRKGIEYAIDLATGLSRAYHPRRVRLLISHHAGDEGGEYLESLRARAGNVGVDLTLACDHFVSRRGPDDDPCSIFDLRDAYECADWVTYPSLIEGFGNAFLEAVFYRRPILVNRYPVYVSDIAPCGFDVIEIDERMTDRTAAEVARLLARPRLVREMTDHNYDVASRNFSYEVAEERLERLLEGLRL